MLRTDSLEKTPMLGKIDGRRRGRQRMSWLDSITHSMDKSLSKLWEWWRTGEPGVLQSMGSQRVGHDWATEQQQSLANSYRFLTIWIFYFSYRKSKFQKSCCITSTMMVINKKGKKQVLVRMCTNWMARSCWWDCKVAQPSWKMFGSSSARLA